MLGEKIRELRESQGMVQRQIAAKLEVDTAYISKAEKNEKIISRSHLKKLSLILNIAENDLLTLWLADKIYEIVKNENVGVKSIELVQKKMKDNDKKRKSI